jgi:hypothetical protein
MLGLSKDELRVLTGAVAAAIPSGGVSGGRGLLHRRWDSGGYQERLPINL